MYLIHKVVLFCNLNLQQQLMVCTKYILYIWYSDKERLDCKTLQNSVMTWIRGNLYPSI